MRLTIVNISTAISTVDFNAVVAAIRRQVTEDFQPEWNTPATIRAAKLDLTQKKVVIKGVHQAIVYVGDSATDPTRGIDSAYGYHSTNHDKIPYGFVYLDISEKYHEPWTSTLSHEVLELLADPSAVLSVAGPDPHNAKRTVRYDLEICDPTQSDTYLIDGVHVSNFVTRAYFGMVGGSSSTNFLKLSLKPFGVRPNGYVQYEASHKTHEIDGAKLAKMATERRAARALMKHGRRNSRRAERRYS